MKYSKAIGPMIRDREKAKSLTSPPSILIKAYGRMMFYVK
jgi:hypothetical protein